MTVAAAHLVNDGPTSVKIDAIVKQRQIRNMIVNMSLARPRLTEAFESSTFTGISQVKHFVSPLHRRPPQFKQAGIDRVYAPHTTAAIGYSPHFCFRFVSKRE